MCYWSTYYKIESNYKGTTYFIVRRCPSGPSPRSWVRNAVNSVGSTCISVHCTSTTAQYQNILTLKLGFCECWYWPALQGRGIAIFLTLRPSSILDPLQFSLRKMNFQLTQRRYSSNFTKPVTTFFKCFDIGKIFKCRGN